jgi:hypothetical protein
MRRQTGGSIPSSLMWNRCAVFGMSGFAMVLWVIAGTANSKFQSLCNYQAGLLQRVNRFPDIATQVAPLSSGVFKRRQGRIYDLRRPCSSVQGLTQNSRTAGGATLGNRQLFN